MRGTGQSAGGDCMVCGVGTWVGIWRDSDGFTFRACGAAGCIRGCEFVRTAIAHITFRRSSHGREAIASYLRTRERVAGALGGVGRGMTDPREVLTSEIGFDDRELKAERFGAPLGFEVPTCIRCGAIVTKETSGRWVHMGSTTCSKAEPFEPEIRS